MKRIMAAFDGLDFSQSTLEYAIYCAQRTKSELVGVFLDDLLNHSYNLEEIINEKGAISNQRLQKLNKQDEKTRDSSVLLFEKACKKARINYKIHRDKNVAIQELLHESIYCDLLIIDRKEDFSNIKSSAPTDFLLDFLGRVHCPVLIVPDAFKRIEEVIFLYDGEPASVQAIKMFSYTLSSTENERFEVLTVRNKNGTLRVPDGKLIREFLQGRYPMASFVVETGPVKEKILEYLKPKEHAVVVLGAYGRGLLSRLIKPSLADLLIEKIEIPIFVAH